MPVARLLSIPWSFVDDERVQLWTWRTPHFEARIAAESARFSWHVRDLVSVVDDLGRLLMEGRTDDFAEAERGLREVIGKSYPYRYGYAGYAGSLATTFRIGSGQRIDFSQFGAATMIVTLRMPDGREQSYTGTLDTLHHEVTLTPRSGRVLRIKPSCILRIAGENGRRAADVTQADPTYTGIGRIYRGSVEVGCTGRSGYLQHTIDHVADPCPVHEEASRRG